MKMKMKSIKEYNVATITGIIYGFRWKGVG